MAENKEVLEWKLIQKDAEQAYNAQKKKKNSEGKSGIIFLS